MLAMCPTIVKVFFFAFLAAFGRLALNSDSKAAEIDLSK